MVGNTGAKLEDLRLKINVKRAFSVFDLIRFVSLSKSERKRKAYYFVGDFLLVSGISAFFFMLISILQLRNQTELLVIVVVLIYVVNKLFWKFRLAISVFRVFGEMGIESSEINYLKGKFWGVGSSHCTSNFLKVSGFLFSSKNQSEIFAQIAADWREEYFDALYAKEIWRSRGINVRYTYQYLKAMWVKSPISDLIEFVIKIAKP